MTIKSWFILTEFSTPDSVFYNKVNLRNFVRTRLYYDVRNKYLSAMSISGIAVVG